MTTARAEGASRRVRAFVILAIVAAAVIPAVASADGGYWTDPTSDSGTAADIIDVGVVNASDGRMAFAIQMNNDHVITLNDVYQLMIDSDPNGGSATGADYQIQFQLPQVTSRPGWIAHWDGNGFVPVQSQAEFGCCGKGTWVVVINKSEVGSPGWFKFWAVTGTRDGAAATDRAPDSGAYADTLVSVSAVTFHVTPGSSVRPGKNVSATVTVKLSDATTASPDSVTCKAKLSGKPLPSSGTCAWRVPKSARGKTITISVAATYRDQQYTDTIIVHVKKK
jgi:hypothetical protein